MKKKKRYALQFRTVWRTWLELPVSLTRHPQVKVKLIYQLISKQIHRRK